MARTVVRAFLRSLPVVAGVGLLVVTPLTAQARLASADSHTAAPTPDGVALASPADLQPIDVEAVQDESLRRTIDRIEGAPSGTGSEASESTSEQSDPVPFMRGDVFVGMSTGGRIRHYSADGTLLDVLSTGAVWQVTGMCFDAFGDLYAMNFSDQTITKFNDSGQIVEARWGGFMPGRPQSCFVDVFGNVYVGLVDRPSGDLLLKFDSGGRLLAGWRPATEWRGTDWIDLWADGCTMLYTSQYVNIKRFNVCTGQQMSDFSYPGAAQCMTIRIRPNAEVMAACGYLARMSPTGSVISLASYSNNGAPFWGYFGLALDQTGDTVWMTAVTSPQAGRHHILHVDIETGDALHAIEVADDEVNGVAIYGSSRPGWPDRDPPEPLPIEATYDPCNNPNYVHEPGVQQACAALVNDPVNVRTGALSSSKVDAAMPSVGEAFRFERSYTSLDTATSDLGIAWTDSYQARLSFQPGAITWRTGGGAQIVFPERADGSYATPWYSGARLSVHGSGYRIVTAGQTHYLFNALGRLTAVKDRNGQGVTLVYGANGKRSTLTDSAGRVVTFQYNGQGLLERMTLPDGRYVGYGYTNGRLTTVTDLRGNPYTYSYDAGGRLRSEVDQNNHLVVENTYGTNGRVTRQEDGNGRITRYAWNQDTLTATVTDARNHDWKYVFDGMLLVRKTDPFGNRVGYAYDELTGDLIRYRDALDRDVTMTYDDRHNLLTRTAPAPLSHREEWTYNSRNDVTSQKDGRGHRTDYGYDAAGNLTSVTGPDPDGGGPLPRPVTTYTRDPGGTGLVVSITDPRQKVTSFGYDPATRELSSITTPLNEKTTMTYDTAGRLRTLVEPRGNASGAQPADYTTTFTYDDADHLTELVAPDPDGTGPQAPPHTEWAYDPAGQLETLTDANGNATGYAYDAMNQLTSVTAPDPDGAGPQVRPVTTYTYDPAGNLETRTDANNHTTTYAYDIANRLTRVASPTGQQWTYTYDKNGNRRTKVDANGNATPTVGDGQTTYGYDVLGRLSSISYSDATPSVFLAYDASNNLTQLSDGAGSESYAYDALNRLSSATRGSNTFGYGYDAAGNRTQTTYPDGTVITATYDNDGRLAGVTSGGLTTSYGYDAAGNLTTTTLPGANGYVETRTYDRAGRLTGVTNKKGATTLSAFAATLDPAGNPLATVRSGAIAETATYTYDGLDRLIGVCFKASCPLANDPFIRWTYDGVGNRLSEARPTGTKTYTYNAADQLTQAGTTSYTYDGNGNQKTAGSTTFAYDLADRLTATTTGTTTTSYSYDGLGRRLTAATGTTAAKTTKYLWDTNGALPEIALERDGANKLLRRYTYGERRISMNTGTTPFYYHYDPLGSVVNMTNATGATQWTNTYEPYGSTRTETKNDSKAPANLMKFAGEYLDPTGLYHLRARQYDPATGRFLTTDPLPRPASAPHMSTYAYAEDQPTTLIDPSGLGAIGNTCGSIVCWWNQQAGPYAKACLSGAIEGAGVGWLTGGGLVFSAAVGCGQDLASLYVERRWGPIAGAMTNLGLKGLDAYKILKRTSFTTTRVVGAATCGGAGAVAAAASCTVTINRGDQGTLNITGTVLTVVGWNS